MRDKLRINLDYARRAGLLADLGVVLLTLKALVKGSGEVDQKSE
jgi:lipopolysaccharide/colanic/teichoic acid biosynthesis glycosyltransferase